MLCYEAHYKAVITGIQSFYGQHLDQGKEKKKQGSTCVLPAITTICTYNVEADLMGARLRVSLLSERWQLLKYLNWLHG
jgi:hypothetical protein